MADSACIIELASNADEYFMNSALDDIMIHPRYPTQKILLGNSNSQIPSLTVTSNAIGVFRTSPAYPLDVQGDINFTGTFLQNGIPYIGSQWSNSDSNVFLLGSNVGIATSNPSAKLHVVGNTIIDGDIDITGTITSSGGGGGGLSSQWASDVSNVYIGRNSNVGIGVSNPSAPLEVKGDTKISGNLIMNNRLIMSSLQIKRRQGNQANITSTAVIGFSNVFDGVILSIGSNEPAASQALRAMWSSNEIFTVTGEGDIGIGTSNPSAKLHVIGSTIIDGDINISGTITSSGGGSGLFSQWSNDLSNVFLGESSNVGIGISNPSVPLEVNGDTKISGNLIMNNRFIMSSLQINRRQGNHANVTSTSVKGFSNVSDGVILSIGSNEPAASQSLRAMWSSNEVFRVTGEGDIGIGTSNPSAKLHVTGDIRTTGTIYSKHTITEKVLLPSGAYMIGSGWDWSNTWIASGSNGGFVLRNNDKGGLEIYTGKSNNGLSINATFSSNGNFALGSYLPSEKLDVYSGNIKSSSNIYAMNRVGIGMSNPAYPLDVTGDINFTGNILQNGVPYSSSSLRSTSNGVIINIGSNTPASAQSLRAIWSNNEIFTVTGEGNVGIGTSNPSSKLHVEGTIYATADVVVSSDIRAKSNIERIGDPLDKIQQLNGYTFNMIEQPPDQTKLTSKYTGLIAQELIKVLPEAIHIDKNDRYSVAYGNIMGLVVEAIKALNDKHEKRIDALERRIEQLST